ncbi:MAG: NAD-dependent epimerase/dehydratase family protein [Chromatiaceae bacterium]|nr:NAD-dependent epimerase/dehydratase family protein [Gammaproteobacteria bacterium]MCP5300205.1 NAD-dependent epimerase/dehydratase family protein [Chromatiaceae bacterium]MCP5422277.1 NAD-dependent epimerase/dehydratase family protein [Chromatiaceae bacterium]
MNYTVLGAGGFIGRHLVRALRAHGAACRVPERDDPSIFDVPLGRVFYCIGLTADFRSRPYATVDAHVGILRSVLERADFDRLVYLSSTRVYSGAPDTVETAVLSVTAHDADQLYNLSKLLGESLALASGRDCRVARLSNVLGPDMGPTNFVGALVDEAARTGSVHLRSALDSVKDYIWIDDAVSALAAIADRGVRPIYNVAGGVNVSHAQIVDLLRARGVDVSVATDGIVTAFPRIRIAALTDDTGWVPSPVLPKLDAWLDSHLQSPS